MEWYLVVSLKIYYHEKLVYIFAGNTKNRIPGNFIGIEYEVIYIILDNISSIQKQRNDECYKEVLPKYNRFLVTKIQL